MLVFTIRADELDPSEGKKGDASLGKKGDASLNCLSEGGKKGTLPLIVCLEKRGRFP